MDSFKSPELYRTILVTPVPEICTGRFIVMRHHRVRSQNPDAAAMVRQPKYGVPCGLAILNSTRKSASWMTCLALAAGATPPDGQRRGACGDGIHLAPC